MSLLEIVPFQRSYGSARSIFLNAASLRGMQVSSVLHPAPGPEGETLHVDVITIGDSAAETVLFLTSGIHGPELQCGSACQTDLLKSGLVDRLPLGLKVVMVHAANPWGAAHGRRYTEENVDLCRNFIAFPFAGALPCEYEEVAQAVDANPCDSSAVAAADAVISRFIEQRGAAAFRKVVMSGQYRYPRGIAFGGSEATWARATLESILREHGARARRVIAVDYHTGYGPYAYGCIVAMQTKERLALVKRIFGEWVLAPREAPSADSYETSGHTTDGYERLFGDIDVVAVVLEIGTYPVSQLLKLLLTEHRFTRHFGHHARDRGLLSAREALADFFLPRDVHWQNYALHRSRQVFEQVLEAVQRG